MRRGGNRRRSTTLMWGLLTLLCAGATAVALLLGLARVAPLGGAQSVVVTACETRAAGKNGYVQCEARTDAGARISLRHDGHPGERVDAARAPWGSYVIPEHGLGAWSAALVLPVGLALTTTVCAAVTRRAARRPR
ncbi:hypothetical protein [Kitasatospora sp. A2-31]|uniref:hypothetical protein n=1 Tax=Kitasatospora sp. A2-31 TaxID=2916414 RepID=UPI001EEA65DF|nr:hypothetical protein [Kitasatospora sp. A2-31]MCG6494082.1 hypothetical protein [Kitasatospora sp. A2-31]